MSVLKKQMVRHSMLVKAGAVSLMSIVILLGVVWPIASKLGDLNKKIQVREKEAEELAKRVAVLSGLDKEILQSRVEILDNALPNKKDVLLYLSTIDSLSRELNLSFRGVSLSPGNVTEASASAQGGRKTKTVPDEVPGVHSLETEVKIEGEKESLFAFLRAIEQSLPLMQVKDAKVVITGENTLSLSLRLGMLWATGDLSNVKGAITLFSDKEEAYFQQLSSYRVFTTAVTQETGASIQKEDIFSPAIINMVTEAGATVASESAQP